MKFVQFRDQVAEIRGVTILPVLLTHEIDDLPMLVGQGDFLGRGDDLDDLVAEVGFQQKVLFAGFQFLTVQNVAHSFSPISQVE